jgi:DNA-binding response OmpR family regulator
VSGIHIGRKKLSIQEVKDNIPWRIMIVDDDEDIRVLISTVLSNQFEIVEAFDGLDALEKLERCQPDFIIMDVMMPLMNGLEASEAIRENPNFSYIPILFISALSSREDMEKAYRSGADLYLTKPIDTSHLLTTVQNTLKKHRYPPQKKQYNLQQIREMEKSGAVTGAPVEAVTSKQPPAIPTAPTAEKVKTCESEYERIAERQPIPTHKESPYVEFRSIVTPRVMVVDDEADMLEFTRMTLREGFEVVTASDGLEAVKKLVIYQPDLFILDIMIPKMSGYQLCQSLRRNVTFQNSPIMFISAKTSQKDIDYAMKLGADMYLTKPFTPKDLLDSMRELFKKRHIEIRAKKIPIKEIEEREKEEKRVFEAREERLLKKKERHQG